MASHYQEFRNFLVKSLADPRFCEFDPALLEVEAKALGVDPELLRSAQERYYSVYLREERAELAVTIPKNLMVLVREHAGALHLGVREYLRSALLTSVNQPDYEPRIHEPELSQDRKKFMALLMDFSAKALVYARARDLGVTISRYLRVVLHDVWSARLEVKRYPVRWQAPSSQFVEVQRKYGPDLRQMRHTIVRKSKV